MKIFDEDNKHVISKVTLFLTPDEASRLAQAAGDLAKSQRNHHHHVSNDDLTNEITVAVYTPENILSFDDESLKIIGDELE